MLIDRVPLKKFFNIRGGQSLIEILVAIAVGIVMIGVAIAIIAPILRANTRTNEAKVAAALGRELFENVRVFGEIDWHNIDTLATTSDYHYHLTTSTASPFTFISGDENIALGTTTYIRFFYVDDTCRLISGGIQKVKDCSTLGAVADPSTKVVTVVYGWPGNTTNTFATYLTRYRSRTLWQTDWSGGPGSDSPVSTTTWRFSNATNVDYSTTTGVIKILEVKPKE